MDEELFDERQADKALIASLLRSSHILWRELEEKRAMLKLLQSSKQGITMSKVMQDLQGAYYLVEEYEQLTEEVAKEIIAHAEHDLTMVKKFLGQQTENVPSAASQITPGTPAVAEQPTANPNAQAAQQLAGDPGQAAQAIVDPNAQPATPADPNAQPAANPVAQPEAPATDPTQAQPQVAQPDPSALPPLQ